MRGLGCWSGEEYLVHAERSFCLFWKGEHKNGGYLSIELKMYLN